MLENLSADEIVSHIHSKQITPEEVVTHYLNRIKKFNPSLKAIVSLKEEEMIIKETKHLAHTDSNKEKLLFGLPLAIKDLFNVKGLPTTYGLSSYKTNIPKKNSIIVDRLIEQGAIIIGKTNIPELAIGCHTTNKLFGVTTNAYDASKSAGGSSGGAASAVAASLVPFADGSDMMGSCRNPGAYANLYGYRPTPGLIPEDRIMKIDSIFPLLSTPGCIARTPNEMALLLDAIVGKHPSDPYSFNVKSSFRAHQIRDDEFNKIKIAWLSDMNGDYKFEPEILDMCEKKLHDLEKNKVKIANAKSQVNTIDLWSSWTTLRSKNIFYYLNEMNIKTREELGYSAQWEYQQGSEISFDDQEVAMTQRIKSIQQINKLFLNYDFLAIPSAQLFPFKKELNYPEEISGHKLDTYHRWMEVVILASLLGLPSISIPVGFNKEGLPMGMQIIGKQRDDLKVISFAKKYEEIFNCSQNKPMNLNYSE
ncbi:MAG: amidase [Candidatus Marinimicrobia bacterium]|nr:amidase [Candidatus Neomarinimicrobiota bacterium]